jgi:hypothetical protein
MGAALEQARLALEIGQAGRDAEQIAGAQVWRKWPSMILVKVNMVPPGYAVSVAKCDYERIMRCGIFLRGS